MRVNAPANLRHLTVTGNGSLSNGGSGGFEYSGPGNTGINIYNSVFAGNWSGSGSPGTSNDMFCFAGIGVRSHVFVQRGNCTFQSTTGPALTGEARLAPLFDYGNGIPTHALLDDSPLIDAAGNGAGNAACRPADARGVPRPANDCDIGAHERVFNHVVNASGDFPDANPGNGVCATSNGQCTLRAAVQEAARLATPQTIRVPPGTYSVTGMQDGYSAIWGIGSSDPRAITLVGDIDAPESVVIAVTGLGGAFEVSGLLTASDVEYRATPALALMGLTIQDANRPEGSVNFPELGGAIRVDGGNLLVYRSILRNNRVPRGNGGAIGVDRRFETSRRRMVAIVEESSLLDNDAIGGSQGEGGNGGAIAAPLSGVFLTRPTLIVRNSTFSGNEATNRGGAIFGSGRVLFSTISGNRALRGGGVYRSGPADNVLSLGNSIVHGNALNSGVTPFGPDCAVDPNGGVTPIVSYGYNLIGNATDCTRSGEPALDIVNAAPQLNALRGDLGPTPVFFPLPTSAAVDAIPGTRCVDFADGTRLRFDQNGDLRQGTFSTAQCFIGAVEGAAAPPADPVFADGFEAPP
jgi:predicted outer membrane repeat protein